MASDFKRKHHIENSDELLVAGYLNAINEFDCGVPPLVHSLCVLYWKYTDALTVCGQHITINPGQDGQYLSIARLVAHDSSNEENMRSFAWGTVGLSGQSVYGDFDINDQEPNAVYKWTFGVLLNHDLTTAIGICTTTKYRNMPYTDAIDEHSKEEFYAMEFWHTITKRGSSIREYPAFTNGDTVLMECDISAQTLTLKVNQNSRMAVFKNINYSRTFRVAIVLRKLGDGVTLLNFKSIKR